MTDILGDDEAVAVLTRFRAIVRHIASEHGVRVAKWLGDGAMFVGTAVPPVVPAMLELSTRLDRMNVALPLRAGIASGNVILFEGDDYVGGPVNLAAHLCDSAAPGEVLASEEVVAAVGDEFAAVLAGERQVRGLVHPVQVWRFASGEAGKSPRRGERSL
jgi:class 3 adenylate cyclase